MASQGWAESQNKAIVGVSEVVSSSVPPMIRAIPGNPSASTKTGDPQRGQNLRSSFRPLSPLLVKPIPPGEARVWFYRVYLPSDTLNMTKVTMNGVYGYAQLG